MSIGRVHTINPHQRSLLSPVRLLVRMCKIPAFFPVIAPSYYVLRAQKQFAACAQPTSEIQYRRIGELSR